MRVGDFLKRVRVPIAIESDKDYQLLTIRLHHKGVVSRAVKRGSEIGANTMYQVKAGQFILSGIDARHGAFGIVPDELDGAVVTNDFWYFDVNHDLVDRDFFLLLTATSYFDDLCRLASDGTTNRVRLQAERFFNFDLDIPDIKHQKTALKRYLAFRKPFDEVVAEIESQKRHLSHLRQSLLLEAVSGRLTAAWRKKHGGGESGRELLQRIRREKERLVKEKKIKKEKPLPPIKPEEIPFDVPETWTWARTSSIAESRLGKMLDRVKNKGVAQLYLRNVNVRWFDFDLSDLLMMRIEDREVEELTLKQDDILICEGGEPGRCAIWDNRMENIFFQKAIHRVRLHGGILPTFYCYCLWCDAMSSRLNDFFTGSGIQHLTGKGLAKYFIPLPPLTEQKEIVRQLDILLGDCDALEAEIRANEARAVMLQQSILRDAFQQDAMPVTKPKKKPVVPPKPELLPIDRDTPKNRYALAVLLTLLEKKKTVSGQLLDGIWTRLASYDNIFNCLDDADKLRFRGMDKKYATFFSAMKVDETIYWRDLLGPTIEQECISHDKSGVYTKARFFDRALSEFASDNLAPLVEFAITAYDRLKHETSAPEPVKQPQGKRKAAHSIR